MSNDNMNQLSRPDLTQQTVLARSVQETQEAGATLELALEANQAEASEEKLEVEAQENSAMGVLIRTQTLDNKKEVKTEKAKQAQESVLIRKDDADNLADGFSQRQGNKEYRLDRYYLSQLAEELGLGIHENSDPDEMIILIRKRMSVNGQTPDVAIIDKAFEFLLEVTRSQISQAAEGDKVQLEKILKKIEIAKDKHFASNAIEIQVAQKIIGAVDAVVETTGQTVKETLDRYREVVHNPPDLQALRKFYEAKGYKAMVLELKGLNAYLGGNFKRTNLDNPELAQLASAARKMQALLGVFRQSRAHLPTMKSYLVLNGVLENVA